MNIDDLHQGIRILVEENKALKKENKDLKLTISVLKGNFTTNHSIKDIIKN